MNGTEAPLSSPQRNEAENEPEPQIAGQKRPRRSRAMTLALIAAFIVLIGLAIFLPPLVNLGHYRRSITASMSLGLGRPVYVGGMQLRLLPTPGIAMTDFTVEEDPAFGSEPALHANSVVASLRLSSLWRGRLEVSRISLDEASLNLVRNAAGQWNIDSVLLRASQIPNAPTAEPHPGPRPRFPYIEASDARINFKDGVEKKPFSLMNAEFSMWQASGNEWRLRLKAQPVRTDLELHLSDTGLLNIEGSLRRASSLDAMPVDLTAEWSGAQLGQVSRLLAGFDSGWRGDLDLTATLRGAPGNLTVRSRVRVANLRRLEFQPANTVDVDATCEGAWHHPEHTFTGITCFWPVGRGHLLLNAASLDLASHSGDLQLEINQIPVSFPVALLGLVRPRLASITATGAISGSFQLSQENPGALTGHAEATGVSLSAGSFNLALPTLHFVAQSAAPRRQGHAAIPASRLPNAVALQPLSIPFGGPEPLVVDAHLTRAGFALHLGGQASLDRLTAAGTSFGLLGSPLAALQGKGRAELNATTASTWLAALSTPAPASATTGSIRLQNAEFLPSFLHNPVQIDSADLFLSPEQISWQNALLHYEGLSLRGSLQLPTACNQPIPCPATFTLQSPSLDTGSLEGALLAQPKAGILGQFLSNALGSAKAAPWPPLRGSVQAAALQLGRLPLRNAVAAIAIDGRDLTISSLDGSALGGTLHASGKMSLDSGTPDWTLTAQITGAKAAEAGALFHQRWGSGLLTGDLKLNADGFHLPELLSSATGDFRGTWQNGGLTTSGAASPLSHFSRWTAAGTIASRTLTLTTGTLTRGSQAKGNQATPVRGAISFDRSIDLTVQGRQGPVRITGTLAQPVIMPRQ